MPIYIQPTMRQHHSPVPPAPTFPQRGFTLTEMAVVLVIVALLIGGMVMPMSAQQDIRLVNETNTSLSNIRDALLGFAVINGRLPCPDTDGNGQENPVGGSACTNQEGDFPYATVGTAQSDAYGYRFRYRVSATFSSSTPFTTLSSGDITVITRGDDPTTTGTSESKAENALITSAPAVIISVGKNGYGGLPFNGGARRPNPTTSTDEFLNYSGNKKVSRLASSASTGCSDTAEGSPFCEIDDIVTWLPTTILINRMISAGELP